jgi:antitoxin (DNA-binding transcriptional repressor) of toxin-antitoxin stability system
VVGGTDVGILDHDLRAAALAALKIPRDRCRAFAVARSWRASAEQFLANIVAANDLPPERVAPRVAKAAAH